MWADDGSPEQLTGQEEGSGMPPSMHRREPASMGGLAQITISEPATARRFGGTTGPARRFATCLDCIDV